LAIIAFQHLAGSSRPSSSSSESGLASATRLMKRSFSSPVLRVAAVRVEAVADHRLALDLEVGDHRHDRRRHLAEVDIGVGDVGPDRRDDVADGDDAHDKLLQAAARRIWRLSSHQATSAFSTFQPIPLMKAAR
jgi:hypothetical protein